MAHGHTHAYFVQTKNLSLALIALSRCVLFVHSLFLRIMQSQVMKSGKKLYGLNWKFDIRTVKIIALNIVEYLPTIALTVG